MITRRFGRTELQMPVFSCGGMRFQHRWQDISLEEVPQDNQTNLEATVHRAVDLGICHIETARDYGSSERQLGLVLPQFPRAELIVQTKLRPHADAAVFLDHFTQSLARLQLQHVDLLAIHGINTFRQLWWSIRPGGCLEAARQLVDEGKVRHVGFSTHGPLDVILAALDHQGPGNVGFDYMNLHWYYINQQNLPAIEAAYRADMGIFIISPSNKGGMLYRPSDRLVELCRPLHPLVFNLLFCLAQPGVHTLSVGASKPEDFDLQMTALELLDKADQLLPPIIERLRQAMVDAVGPEVARSYTEGLPEWEITPGHINLSVILWLRHLVRAYDMIEYGKMRYNLLGNGEDWFPGLSAAHLDDLDFTKALQNSPFAAQIPGWIRDTHALLYEKPVQRLSQSD